MTDDPPKPPKDPGDAPTDTSPTLEVPTTDTGPAMELTPYTSHTPPYASNTAPYASDTAPYTSDTAPYTSDTAPTNEVPLRAPGLEYPPAPVAEMQTGPVEPEARGLRPEASDEPILPTTYDDNALRDAVGAPVLEPKRMRKVRDDDGEGKPRGKRTMMIVALSLIVGATVVVFVLLGRVNAQRYVIACSTDRVSAEQGRGFPPWGSQPLSGAEWKPIALPPNAECKPRETDEHGELERWYLELLMDRASTTLTARNLLDSVQQGKPNPLDVAAEHLNQALLLSRSPDRRDQRKEVERLLGDVQYWRATLRLREASAALLDASRQFDTAAAQRPRHVTDAGEWASFLRRLVTELSAGPAGVTAAPVPIGSAPSPDREPAPVGTALPVEPEASASEPVVPVDAGLPTGGVLL